MYLSQFPRSSILNIAIIVLTLPRARAEWLSTFIQQTRARYTCIVPPAVERMPLPVWSRSCFFWTHDNLAYSQESVIFVWGTTCTEPFLPKYIPLKYQNPEDMTIFYPTCTKLSKTTFMLLPWLEKVTRKYSCYKLGSQKREYHLILNVNAFSLPISPLVKIHLKKTWIRFTCAFRFNKFDSLFLLKLIVSGEEAVCIFVWLFCHTREFFT